MMLGNLATRALCALLTLSMVGLAQAATLTADGVVLINRGNGFEQVVGQTQVNPSDQVMVNQGSANLSYPDGSSTSLSPGQVYSVGEIGVAPAGTAGAAAGEAAAAGAGTGIAGVPTTTLLVVGGVAAVAGVVGIVASQNKTASSP